MMMVTHVRPGQPAGQRHGSGTSWTCSRSTMRMGCTAESVNGGRR